MSSLSLNTLCNSFMICNASFGEKEKNKITPSPLIPLIDIDSMMNIMQDKLIKEVLHEQVLDKECDMNRVHYVINFTSNTHS